jgi:hypothetical protein
MPRVKIQEGQSVVTSRGVFFGGTEADLTDEEIAANPMIATPIDPPPVIVPDFIRQRFSNAEFVKPE